MRTGDSSVLLGDQHRLQSASWAWPKPHAIYELYSARCVTAVNGRQWCGGVISYSAEAGAATGHVQHVGLVGRILK